jgi:hypothetical protein
MRQLALLKIVYETKRVVAKHRHELRLQYRADMQRWHAAQRRGEDYPRPQLPAMLERDNEEADEEERQLLEILLQEAGFMPADPFAADGRWAPWDGDDDAADDAGGRAPPPPYVPGHPYGFPMPHHFPPASLCLAY